VTEIIRKPLTRKLEKLVDDLAAAIQQYPEKKNEANRKRIIRKVKTLDEKCQKSSKRDAKKRLLKAIDCYDSNDPARSSLFRMTDTLLYLSDIGIEDIPKITGRYNTILELGVNETLKPNVDYLTSVCREEDVRIAIQKYPKILGTNLKKTKAIVRYVQSLGVESIDKVVRRNPSIFGSKIEILKQNARYFRSEGVKREFLAKAVERMPNILTLDIEKYIRPRFDYLRELGIEKEHYGKIIKRTPYIFSVDIEKTKDVVRYFMSKGFSNEDIKHLMIKASSIFPSNLETNIRPTYEYLCEQGVTKEEFLTTAVVITLSLDGRIKPRYDIMERFGKKGQYGASALLKGTNEKFCMLAGCTMKDYNAAVAKYVR